MSKEIIDNALAGLAAVVILFWAYALVVILFLL